MSLLTEQEIADCLGFNTFTSESTKTVFAGVARAIESLVIAKIKAQGQEIFCVFDGDNPVFEATWESACHEHINDAINQYGIDGADKWTVRPLYRLPEGDLS